MKLERLELRVTAALKRRAERVAAKNGLSVNALANLALSLATGHDERLADALERVRREVSRLES